MIHQILTDLKTNGLWYSTPDGLGFRMPDNCEYTRDNVNDLLAVIGMECLDLNGCLSDIQYRNMQSVLSDNNATVRCLTGKYAKYNDLSSYEWDFLKKHLRIKLHDKKKDDITPETDVSEFIDYIRGHIVGKASACAILNEVVYECFEHIGTDTNQIGFHGNHYPVYHTPTVQEKLTIDMRPTVCKWLRKNDLGGITIASRSFIGLNKSDNGYTPPLVLSLLHELRHIVQFQNQLYSENSIRVEPDCYNLIEMMAAEADTMAYEEVFKTRMTDFTKDIMNASRKQIDGKILSGEIPLTVTSNSTSNQKLNTLLRLSDSLTEKQTAEILARCLIAPDGYRMYQILKSYQITLSPRVFNQMNNQINDWKENYYIGSLSDDNFEMTPRYDSQRINRLETHWRQHRGIDYQLMPTSFFNPDTAKCVGIESIFDGKPVDNIGICYQYSGVSDKIIGEIDNRIEERDFAGIINIYQSIYDKNPVLPPPTLFHSDMRDAKRLQKTVKAMKRGDKITDVLETCGFLVNDTFSDNLALSIAMYKQQSSTHQKD